ncbi:M48 family metalloprotease [Lutimonas sp.]|uniref:M48 family metalloprotease n=1 Tax=Lutimonas sp. TaxID=1872403 RepID=UPI003D9BE303
MKTLLQLFMIIGLCTASYAQSIELDKELGNQNAKMVAQEMGIYDDQAKTTYLTAVINRLVLNLEEPLFEYEIHIVPDMSPNAFALPGGHLYITTGLIPILQTEDELACIMGHEIIHSNNRHSIQQIKKSILPKLLEIPGNLIGAVNADLGDIINTPIETSNELLFANYGRKFESEADDEGVQLAAKAGYDPAGMISSLTRLSKTIEVATNKAEEKSYFNDHPYTPDRTEAIEKRMRGMNYPRKAPISKSFLKEFDGILFGNSPNQGVIQENKFLHPDLDFFIAFPKSWILDNQRSSINAYEPNNKAAAFVELDNAELSPEKASNLFLTNLKKEYKSKLTESKEIVINGKKGSMITFIDQIESETMYAYILWLPMEDKLFKLTGVAPIKFKDELDKAALSLRPLNRQEKETIMIQQIRIIEAKEGENLKDLSTRVGNKLKIELTSTINSISPNENLEKGRLVKVVLEAPYLSHTK